MSLFTPHVLSPVSVAGAQLQVGVAGPEGAPWLVLLHGGLGSMEDWAAWVPELARTHRLLALDSRGHGRSTLGDVPLSYPRLEADVLAVMDALGLARAAFLGFSDGGITAMRLASFHPDRVQSLAVAGAQWRLLPGDPAAEILAGVTPAFWRAHFPDAVSAYEAANRQADFPRLVASVVSMWLDAEGYPGEAVARIQAPMLSLRGAEDFLLSESDQTALGDRVPQVRRIDIPGADHGAFLGAAEPFRAPVLAHFQP